MTKISELRLFSTHEHPCSYVKGRKATTIFVDPAATMDASIFSKLSSLGFRRSGAHVYRPRCRQCDACIPVRIPVSLFKPSKSQIRCLKRNEDIELVYTDSIDTDEHYDLYETYIRLRHHDGEMFPASREQYLNFLTQEWQITRFIEFRLGGALLGVSVCDRLDDGISAIYVFFDPTCDKRSLGVFNILQLIDIAKAYSLPYVYLGYWINECQKMSYKTNFQPFQLLVNNTWTTSNKDELASL